MSGSERNTHFSQDETFSRKKIAIFIPTLDGGGAERVMVKLANEFAALGHEVDLVLSRAEGPFIDEVSEIVRVVDLKKRRVRASIIPLARYLRSARPEVLLSALNHANLAAIISRKLASIEVRLIVSERNSIVASEQHVGSRLTTALMRWLYPQAEAVIAVSEALAEELIAKLGLNPTAVTAIANPVDLEEIWGLAKEEPDSTWLNSKETPVILAVGHLEPQKDYQTLLRAFAEIRRRRAVRLIILGEGSERDQLEELARQLGVSESVSLPGFRQNPFAWMRACDVFVLSSRFEGFPNVLLQALACGARVVSTDCPTGPAEILQEGRWGNLVPVADPRALSSAIEMNLDNKANFESVERAQAYECDNIIEKYLSILLAK